MALVQVVQSIRSWPARASSRVCWSWNTASKPDVPAAVSNRQEEHHERCRVRVGLTLELRSPPTVAPGQRPSRPTKCTTTPLTDVRASLPRPALSVSCSHVALPSHTASTRGPVRRPRPRLSPSHEGLVTVHTSRPRCSPFSWALIARWGCSPDLA